MMPPADTAISMPGMPNGAKPWIVRFAGLKNVNSTAITASGTMNLKTLMMLFAFANVFTLE